MGRKQKSSKVSDHISFESDNEELRDEIDKYHDNARSVKSGSYRQKKRVEIEEVLNVEGDESGEDADSGDDFSDFDNNEDEGITANKWGRKRKDHYHTDYIDNDWGGMRDEEMEAAELEEEDALNRQKALDSTAAFSMDDFDDLAISSCPKKIEAETKLEWKLATVKKMNKGTTKLIEEYSQRKDLMAIVVEPLRSVVLALPKDAAIRRQLQMVVDVYSKYLMDILFVLKLKSESWGKKVMKDEIADSHPVNDELARSKKMIEKVDKFLDSNSDVLNKLITKVKNGEDISQIPMPSVQLVKKSSRAAPSFSASDEIEQTAEYEEMGDNDKRLAPSSIAKNSSTAKNKKKKEKHAKVANRRKFKEISKKVRSQVGKVRTEQEKYTGEARGIRMSTIKSTKLIA